MPETDLKIRTRSVGTIRVEPAEIVGASRPQGPMLVLTAKLALSPFDRGEQSFVILRIQCNLFSRRPSLRIADSIVSYEPFQVRHPNQLMTCELGFPLDPYKIGKIEASREDDLNISLDFHFLVGLYAKTAGYQDDLEHRQKDALEDFEISSAQLPIDVPKSHWEEKVLPSLRQAELRPIEGPAKKEVAESGLATAIEQLRLAETYFTNGAYDECVGQCQTVIKTIKSALPKFETGSQGSRRYEWIAETSSTAMEWLTKLYQEDSESPSGSHHAPSTRHFSQHDAEVIMLVTVALVAYVQRSAS